ncbi:hypothetical protein B0H12DRAFT_1136882 [Mycena haematopus]|nr:hypothetical protein B0H12DRAFT_1136882 [Mycena haematopus]
MPSDSSSILPLFTTPRTVPSVPRGPGSSSSAGSNGSPPPEGFVVPPIPPPNCPLRMTRDSNGHRCLPVVSENPLPVNHERVTRLITTRIDIAAKCSSCAELAIDCQFSEAGVPCPACAILGVPDCDFAHPRFLLANLVYQRDNHLHHERSILCTAVRNNQLSPSCFEREYEHAAAWFYSAAQGAIDRFLVNCNATAGLALRGYQQLAACCFDAGLLSRFLAFAHDAHLHPDVLRAVVDRLQAMFLE